MHDAVDVTGASKALLTIKLRTNHFTPEVEKLRAIGLDGAKLKRTFPVGQKELILDITGEFLANDEVVDVADPKTADDVQQRKQKSNVGGRRTLFALLTQSCDLVGIVCRKKTTAVLTYLYCGSDINRSEVEWRDTTVTAKWASVTFIQRQETATEYEPSRKSSQTAMSEATLVNPDAEPSSDDVLSRLFTPSHSFLDQRKRLLASLEEHGILWSQSAFLCRPSQRNREPDRCAQIIVQGLYPDAFLRACLSSSSSSLSAKYGNVLEQWHASRTLEPFQIGTPLSVSSVGLGGAFIA